MTTQEEIKQYFQNNIINRICNNFSFLASNKANNSEVVHLTGNENIDGTKTFTKTTFLYNADSSSGNLAFKKDYDWSTTLTAEQYMGVISFIDTNNTAVGRVDAYSLNNTTVNTRLYSYNPISDTGASLRVCTTNSGDSYVTCPPPTDTNTTTNNQIATTGWTNTRLNAWVPNYTAGISMGFDTNPLSTATKTYTTPSAGQLFVIAKRQTTGQTIRLYINGSVKASLAANVAPLSACFFPIVAKGDVIKIDTDGSSANWQIMTQMFYPFKGV